MEIDFESLMSRKSDEGLMDYLTNADKYTPEAITAAVNELKKREKHISEEQLSQIKTKIQNKIEANKKESESLASNFWQKNTVTNEEAPLFYSQRAIWGFSTFFTVIFGAVLMASNIKEKEKKWIVIGFGILYTTIAIAVLNLLPQNTSLTIGVNAGGALVLTSTFWNRYIGKETKYRVKPIWKPLIISILITIPFLLAIIYS
ncbi:MAG: hypothetical protein JST14_01630 [Bacteroidetes bacterium]|nr:hypothetical protein [Bacteroidota bacterium]